MIVSHRHKFIFLKTQKTAGTALEATLSALCGPDDVITPFRTDNERYRVGRGPQNYRIEHPVKPKRPLLRRILRRPERYWHPSIGFYEHMPAWRVRAYVGENIWRSYYKFAFDRNPWDRQVSWYYYKTRNKEVRPAFERFMSSKRHAYVNNHDIYMIEGSVAIDFVGRYENLQGDFKSALASIGITEQMPIPKVNVVPGKEWRPSYREYYTPETHALIANWYAPEINLFDYKF